MEWVQEGRNYFMESHKTQIQDLPVGVYILKLSQAGFYLKYQFDQFKFDYKIYDMETQFINRIIKQYVNTKGNLGVLMNGLKGTGKTVCAKMISNALNIPVIIVPTYYADLPSFINSFREDGLFFFDEYEKIYKNTKDDVDILTVMDGVMDNGFRRVWMLTTNNKYLNDNMLERPGRIRYVKNFSDLSKETIELIIDDRLKHVEFKEDLIQYISQLSLITVDLVKSIIDEVNIHNESPKEFKGVFNATTRDTSYDVYITYKNKRKKEQLWYSDREVSPLKFDETSLGQPFSIGDKIFGEILEIHTENTATIQMGRGQNVKEQMIRIEKIDKTHRSFKKSYAYDYDY